MPKVTTEAAKRAWMTYQQTMGPERVDQDEETGVRAMQAALEELAHADRGHARIFRVGHGPITVMIFQGSELLAIGETLKAQEARTFLEDLWGAPRIVGEFPPDPD